MARSRGPGNVDGRTTLVVCTPSVVRYAVIAIAPICAMVEIAETHRTNSRERFTINYIAEVFEIARGIIYRTAMRVQEIGVIKTEYRPPLVEVSAPPDSPTL